MVTLLFSILLSASGLAVAVWLWLIRGRAAAAFGHGGTAVALTAFAVLANASPVLAGKYDSALIGLLVLALLAWVVLSRRASLRGPADVWSRVSWLMSAALLAWCVAVDVLVDDGVYGPRLAAYAASAVLLLTAGLMAGRTALDTRATAYIGLAVLAVVSIPTVLYGQAWRPCPTGKFAKCSIAGGLFRSFFESENYIAILASFTLVVAICALRRAKLAAAVSFCLLVIVASGSRTSLLALGAAGIWLLGAWAVERRHRVHRIPAIACLGITLAVLCIATYLTWTAHRNTMSSRGEIWIVARDYIANRQFTGVGVSKWYYLRNNNKAPWHFFHSGYVLAVFSGGLIALTLWGLWLAALLHGPARDGRALSAKAPVILLLIYSFTEVVWNPLSVDGLSWIWLTLMLTQAAVRPPNPVPADPPPQVGEPAEPLAAPTAGSHPANARGRQRPEAEPSCD